MKVPYFCSVLISNCYALGRFSTRFIFKRMDGAIFPTTLSCGPTQLTSLSAVVVFAGFDISRPPRATTTGVIIVVVVVF